MGFYQIQRDISNTWKLDAEANGARADVERSSADGNRGVCITGVFMYSRSKCLRVLVTFLFVFDHALLAMRSILWRIPKKAICSVPVLQLNILRFL